MNLETIDKWLDEEYGCSYTRLGELHDFYIEKYNNLKEENEQLKKIIKEYERLNKENGRGFKITSVQEYSLSELVSFKSYKVNWDVLKEWIYKRHGLYVPEIAENSTYQAVLNKMEELEQRSYYDE